MVPPPSAENREESPHMLLSDEGETPPIFPVVCIGGSAGSLSAYIKILRQIRVNVGMAVVIVSHRPMGDSGQFTALLAKTTHMEVIEVTDGMLLERGRIFVAPPHREITTDGVALRISVGLTENHGWPTLISRFLFSLASSCTSRAIAIYRFRSGLRRELCAGCGQRGRRSDACPI